LEKFTETYLQTFCRCCDALFLNFRLTWCVDVQKKQHLDRFDPRPLALWAILAAFSSMSPAQAETRQAVTDGLSTDAVATEVQESSINPDAQGATVQNVQPVELAANPSPAIAAATTNAVFEAATPEPMASETIPTVTPSEVAPAEVAPVIVPQAVALNANKTPAATDATTPTEPATISQNVIAPNTPDTSNSDSEPRVLIGEIEIVGTGGNAELDQAVVKAIETQAGRPSTVSQIRNDVNRIYATGLFANVQAIPEDTDLGVKVTYQVVPNPVLTSVTVQSLPLDSAKQITPPEVVQSIYGDRYGQIINLNDFQEGSGKLGQLEQWYRDNGYDLAKVIGIDEPTPDGKITLVVVEGVIEDIKVSFIDENNESVEGKTRDFIITRELQLKPGDVFDRNIAQQDLQRVFGLGLFEDIQLEFAGGEKDPTQAILNIKVIEANTGSIAAGGGISSASGFFGTLSYQQQNLGGNNHRLATELQLGTREALFDVSFTDPWIANDPYRTSYTVNAFRRRSLSLIFDGGDTDVDLLESGDRPRVNRLGGGVTFSRPLSKDVFARSDWSASVGFQYQRVSVTNQDGDVEFIDQAGKQLSFSDTGEDDLFSLRFNLVRDKRNNPTEPTGGSITRLGSDQTLPFGSGSIFFNRLRASHTFYMKSPFKLPTPAKEGNHVLAFNLQGGVIIGDLPPYEAFSLGGSNSVRGYEEGAVGSGRDYFQASAEYRFALRGLCNGSRYWEGCSWGSGGNPW
jgi:outer membrane protein insertion porin family